MFFIFNSSRVITVAVGVAYFSVLVVNDNFDIFFLGNLSLF
jgi:hypothetical protein